VVLGVKSHLKAQTPKCLWHLAFSEGPTTECEEPALQTQTPKCLWHLAFSEGPTTECEEPRTHHGV
jgi:hypothetical protein